MVFAVGNHQGGSALNGILLAQLNILFGNQLFVGNTGLVQQVLRNLAVGAGDAGEQNRLGICLNLCLTQLQKSVSDLTEALRGTVKPNAAELYRIVEDDYANLLKNLNELVHE